MFLQWSKQKYNFLDIACILTFWAVHVHGFFPTDWREKHFGGNGVSHAAQTKQAYEHLAAKYFPAIQPLKMSMRKARDAISRANAEVDNDQKTSAKHFDGESFEAGATRLITLKQEVFANLDAGNVDEARKTLGGALHTLQDFYAHTNWVELGNDDINFALGKSTSLPHANFGDATCASCGPVGRSLLECHDCHNNTHGYKLLTSGYYFGEDSPPAGVAIPEHKCHHGGIMDNAKGAVWGMTVGDVTPGINKDSNDCIWSPHNKLHPMAARLATKATIQYIEDIIAELDARKIRLLFGVERTVIFAIDTTSSMSSIIADLQELAISTANDRLDTFEEPNSLVIAILKNSTSGLDVNTSKNAPFQSAISGLIADRSAGCVELSPTGLLELARLVEEPADIFIITDAAAKDSDLHSHIITTAYEKGIKFNIFRFDSRCNDSLAEREDSASTSMYGTIAAATGWSYHSLSRAEFHNISDLLDTVAKRDNTAILKIYDTARSQTILAYKAPVDSKMSEMNVLIRGVGVNLSLAKPDGSCFDLRSAGVTATSLTDGLFVSIKSPATGFWTISIAGEGGFSLDVTGFTTLHLSTFDFVTLSGRPGHQGYLPISTQPLYGHQIAAAAIIDGSFLSANFDLRSPSGKVVVDATMEPGSGANGAPPATSFFGEMTLVPGTLYAYCFGLDSESVPYQRVLPFPYTPILSNTTMK